MVTVGTLGGNLKRKYADKNKPTESIKEKEAAFKAKYGRGPSTDSEIDEVYGVGAATKALDEVYEKREKK